MEQHEGYHAGNEQDFVDLYSGIRSDQFSIFV